MSVWRDQSQEVIARVTQEVGTGDLDMLEKAIRAAYPFGKRRYHPYKIWLQEVKAHMWWLRARKGVVQPKEAPLFEGRLF